MTADVAFESDEPPRVAPFLWMPIWLAAMLHFGAWLTFGYWLVSRVPRMKDIFFDFGISPPQVVVTIIDISDTAVAYWYVGLVLLLLMATADACIDRWFLVNSQFVFRTLWFLFGFVPPIALLLAGMLAIDLAFFGLWSSFSSTPWTSYPMPPTSP